MSILAPISAGELVDKITILRVKAERIGDAIQHLEQLDQAGAGYISSNPSLSASR